MAVSYGFVYTKTLERDKMLALERSGGNYDRTMVISQASKTDLLWWKINIVHRHCKIKQYTFSVEFFF